MFTRAFAVWCLIFALEVVHGVLRTMWLVPLVGDFRARQVGVLTGSLLILAVALLAIRWIGARGRRDLLRVGLLWVVLMTGAEVLLGRAVFGYPWSRIAEDFDVTRGGLLGFGMLVLFAAPWLASAVQRARGRETG
jgi:apolipoprotein N-acyltransferase